MEAGMATPNDFSPADWQRIEAAPFMAGLAVSYSDLSSKVGIADEASATGNAIKSGSSSTSELVRTLAERFAQGQRPTMPSIPSKPGEAQNALIEGCRTAIGLVAAKAPSESSAYARFLIDVAKAAAEATREGGFIGIGFKKVSEGEASALTA